MLSLPTLETAQALQKQHTFHVHVFAGEDYRNFTIHGFKRYQLEMGYKAVTNEMELSILFSSLSSLAIT